MKSQNMREYRSLVSARHNGIRETVLQEELRALEAFRELAAYGLLNNTLAGKADQSARLRENNVAEHRKACGHAAHGRVGQNGDKELAALLQSAECLRGLNHLHERDDALLHSRAAGAGVENDRELFLGRTLCHTRNFFAQVMSHGTHQKARVTDTDGGRNTVNRDLTRHDRLIETGTLLDFPEFLLVLRKVERIHDRKFLVPLLKASRIREQFNSALRVNADIGAAARAGKIVCPHVLHAVYGTALLALSHYDFRFCFCCVSLEKIDAHFPCHFPRIKVSSASTAFSSSTYAVAFPLPTGPFTFSISQTSLSRSPGTTLRRNRA